MANYKIFEEKKEELSRKHLLSIFPFLIVCAGLGFFLAFRQMSFGEMLPAFLITLVIFAGASALGLFWGLRIYKDNHLNICFVTDEGTFSILRKEKEILRVSSEDILKIEQYPDKKVTVFISRKKRVNLNDSIENYPSLLDDLAEMHPIQQVKKKPGKLLKYGLILLTLVPYLAFQVSRNYYITLISGSLFFLFMLFSLVRILTQKETDKRVKIASLAILFLLYDIGQKIYHLI